MYMCKGFVSAKSERHKKIATDGDLTILKMKIFNPGTNTPMEYSMFAYVDRVYVKEPTQETSIHAKLGMCTIFSPPVAVCLSNVMWVKVILVL